jgi:hypothetical protein
MATAGLVAGLLAMLADAGLGQAHSQAKLDAAYTVTLLGIPIGHGTWTVDVHETRFSATANGETAGLMRVFAGGRGTAKAEGAMAGRQPVTSDYMLHVDAGHSTDELKILFNGGKAREYLTHPQPPDPSRVPVTDANRAGVLDPMTALLIRVPGNGDLAAPGSCQHKVAVFDGRMRYDLLLTFKRLVGVKVAGYQGPVVACAVNFSPVAGYDPNRSAIKYLQAQRGIELWLAPVSGTRLVVPFRLTVPTPLGPGVLQATRFVASPQRHAAALSPN